MEYVNFLKKWNINLRLSSVYYLQNNLSAKVGFRITKRILLCKVDPSARKLDNNKAVKALMMHMNTLCQQTEICLAIKLFGRPIRDHLLIQDIKQQRELQEIGIKQVEALVKQQLTQKVPQSEPKHLLLKDVWDSLQIRNHDRNHPTKWNNTSFIADILPNRQYWIVIDESQRITQCKHWLLWRIFLVCYRSEQIAIKSPTMTTQHHQWTLIELRRSWIQWFHSFQHH